MRRLLADTSFWVAYYNKKDLNHDRAVSFYQKTSYIYVITDYIFDETVTLLLVRANKSVATNVGNLLLSDDRIDFFKIDQAVFNHAWKIFSRYKDKQWSFTDCTSFVIAKALKIATVSFDKHFRQFGIQVFP